jgi:hypothetical protein
MPGLPPKFGHRVTTCSSRYELYIHQTLFLSYQTTWNRFSGVGLGYLGCQNNFPSVGGDGMQKYGFARGRLASAQRQPTHMATTPVAGDPLVVVHSAAESPSAACFIRILWVAEDVSISPMRSVGVLPGAAHVHLAPLDV